MHQSRQTWVESRLRWPILERVHLLGNHIGVGADGAGEEFGWLEDGQADFAVAVGGEDFAGGLLDAVPEGGVWREDVANALQ